MLNLTLEQKRNLQATGYIFIAGQLVAFLYVALSDGFESWFPFINGILVATAITALVGFYEFVVFTPSLRKKGFRIVLILRVVLYTVSIVLVMFVLLIFTRMVRYDNNFTGILWSEEFQDYLRYGDFKTVVAYVLGVVFLTNFTMQMNRKMGQGVLMGFILGKYSKPREVERYLMFVKILGAGRMSETMGNEKFLQFVNEVLYDITDSILDRQGFIAEYVDSEMLITWPVDKAVSNSNCVRMFFDLQAVAMREKLKLYEKYGGVPAFAAALHRGKLVLGEVGRIKSEIVYIGDPINTTHRMLQFAERPGELVVSQEALEGLEVPAVYQLSELGSMRLRGKHKDSELKLITQTT